MPVAKPGEPPVEHPGGERSGAERPDEAAQSGRRPVSRRRLSRVAAVQALYQIDLNGEAPEPVILQFIQHRLGREVDGMLMDADQDFFVALVRGVSSRRAELDEKIAAAMTAGRDPDRLEVVLRAILRAGTFEITARSDVPPRVAIKEYIDLTADFFSEKETALTNAILDRVARTARPEELGGGRAPAG